MAEKPSIEKQIQEHINDPELRYLLTHNADFASLFSTIENTYLTLNTDLEKIKQTLKHRSIAYESTQKLLTQQNQEISHRANHDSLTGLPNREFILDRLESSILQSHRNITPFALLFIDLDKFKSVNDNFGHDYGDLLLQKVAGRLKTVIRETDSIARLAGDEFCILLMNIQSPTDSARVARTIFREFSKSCLIKEQQFQVNMSIGISHYPEDGKTTTTLLKNADIAMYEAKQKGSNNFQFYEKRLTEQVTQRIEFEKDLSQAIDHNELEIILRPQLDTKTGDIIGAAAKLIWQHPIRGSINAVSFYDVARENKLLLPIFEWLLGQCCHQLKSWKKLGLPSVTISVPVYQRQFLHKNFIRSLIRIINTYPDSFQFIELLVNEDVVAVDGNLALRQFKQINKLGLSTALTQCGRGLLPTQFFLKAKINTIYLDEELIQEIDTSEENTRLIKAILSLAKELELKTHAPGITKKIQQLYLEKMRCDQLSGSYLSQSMSIKDFKIVLSRFKEPDQAIHVQDNLLLG